MSRLWKLDPCENVYQIEKLYEYETRDSLPLSLEGRIIDDKEIIETLNVCDTDVLLYEIQS